MKEYLPFLLQNELIKYSDKDRTFTITNKGLPFLEICIPCRYNYLLNNIALMQPQMKI